MKLSAIAAFSGTADNDLDLLVGTHDNGDGTFSDYLYKMSDLSIGAHGAAGEIQVSDGAGGFTSSPTFVKTAALFGLEWGTGPAMLLDNGYGSSFPNSTQFQVNDAGGTDLLKLTPGTGIYIIGEGNGRLTLNSTTKAATLTPLAGFGSGVVAVNNSGVLSVTNVAGALVASYKNTGLTGSASSIINYAVAGVNAYYTYEIGCRLTVNTVTTTGITIQLIYTDASNTVRGINLYNMPTGNAGSGGNAVSTAGTFIFPNFIIDVKTGTSIVISTVLSGSSIMNYNIGLTVDFSN